MPTICARPSSVDDIGAVNVIHCPIGSTSSSGQRRAANVSSMMATGDDDVPWRSATVKSRPRSSVRPSERK